MQAEAHTQAAPRRKIEPVLRVQFLVTAYDCGGYGDDRSREFTNGDEAVAYAKGLDKRFGAKVTQKVTMEPLYIDIPLD